MSVIKKSCILVFVFFCANVSAQNVNKQPSSMKYSENVSYDIYFKLGFMSRAGDATFSYNNDNSVADASSRYEMSFKTAKFFDNFFKMRDTLSSYYSNDNRLIYSRKGSDEGGYYSVDELKFKYSNDTAMIHSLRYTPSRVRIDTTLMFTGGGDVTDLLGALYFLRGVDRSKLKNGDVFPITVAIGRDLVIVQFVYQHQAIVEHGKAKYNTRYFKMNIYDNAFESTTSSAEVWVGDDDNFLPIKVRSKLKIGAAEIYFKSSSNLAHPLTCRLETKK